MRNVILTVIGTLVVIYGLGVLGRTGQRLNKVPTQFEQELEELSYDENKEGEWCRIFTTVSPAARHGIIVSGMSQAPELYPGDQDVLHVANIFKNNPSCRTAYAKHAVILCNDGYSDAKVVTEAPMIALGECL